MISQINGAAIRGAYTNSFGENREVSQKSVATVSKQGDTSRIEELKNSIQSGEYQINLQALSEKIAQELL